MKSISVLFVGCGDLGERSGLLLQALGCSISGIRRSARHLPAGFDSHTADYTATGSLAFIEDLRPDYVVATLNPTQRSVEGYQAGFVQGTVNLLAGLGSHVPRHIISVSSTRVFAEQDGGWVDEQSALSEDDPRALAMIEAEQALLDGPADATVVRFAGIYGAPGGRLVSRVARGELCPSSPVRYSNRIHRQDCAGFLCHLLQLANDGKRLEPVYVGVDDKSVPQYEVECWLAEQLGVVGRDQALSTPRASGHKRCRNRLLHESGYRLNYPDYRSGYRAVLDAQ